MHNRKLSTRVAGVAVLISLVYMTFPRAAEQQSIRRVHPKEPAEALKTFSVPKGFRMDVLAHEPFVRDPVQIAYDEQGRMYVVELTSYPHPENSRDKALGSVRFV